MTLQQCPFCGEDVRLLPQHLGKCQQAPRGHAEEEKRGTFT